MNRATSGIGAGGGTDTVLFGTGIAATDVTVSQARNGQDLLLSLAGGGSVTLFETLKEYAGYQIEQVQFADGTIWDRATLLARSTMATSPSSAWIRGDANANQFYGFETADTFEGGGGDDYIAGGNGSDTYRYAAGDGNDRIDELGTITDTDVLTLVDINAGQVALRRDGNHLYVRDVSSGSEIRIENQFYSDAVYGIEQIAFADGTLWNREAIDSNSLDESSRIKTLQDSSDTTMVANFSMGRYSENSFNDDFVAFAETSKSRDNVRLTTAAARLSDAISTFNKTNAFDMPNYHAVDSGMLSHRLFANQRLR